MITYLLHQRRRGGKKLWRCKCLIRPNLNCHSDMLTNAMHELGPNEDMISGHFCLILFWVGSTRLMMINNIKNEKKSFARPHRVKRAW